MAPDDCWRNEPRVTPDNEQAWALYSLFDTQWDAGMSGYRLRYIYDAAIDLASRCGFEGDALVDLVERLKVIEDAVREIEILRYQMDERKRKQNERRGGAGDREVIGKG